MIYTQIKKYLNKKIKKKKENYKKYAVLVLEVFLISYYIIFICIFFIVSVLTNSMNEIVVNEYYDQIVKQATKK